MFMGNIFLIFIIIILIELIVQHCVILVVLLGALYIKLELESE